MKNDAPFGQGPGVIWSRMSGGRCRGRRHTQVRISQLRCFSTIAQLENVSQAAELLHLSQSSLSKNLATLEEELGAPLFDRKGRRLILNPAGARMLEFSNMVLRELGYAMDDIHMLSTGSESRLKIGMAGCCDQLTECLAAFRQDHPETEFVLTGDIEDIEHLDINEYDMLICPDSWEYQKFRGYPLYEERYALAVPAGHPLARSPFIRPKAMENLDIVFLRDGRKYVEFPFQICGALAISFRTQCFADSRELHRQMIARGLCAGFVPLSCSALYRSDSAIRLVPIRDQRFERQMMVCFRREKYLSEVARAFRDHMLAFFKVEMNPAPAATGQTEPPAAHPDGTI